MIYEVNGYTLNLASSLANALNPYALFRIEQEKLEVISINPDRTTKLTFSATLNVVEPTEKNEFTLNIQQIFPLIKSISRQFVNITEEVDTRRLVLRTETDTFKIPKLESLLIDVGEEIADEDVKLKFKTRVKDLIRILRNFKEVEKSFSIAKEGERLFVCSATESFDLKSELKILEPFEDNNFESNEPMFNGRLLLPVLNPMAELTAQIEIGKIFSLRVDSEVGDFSLLIQLAPLAEVTDYDWTVEEEIEAQLLEQNEIQDLDLNEDE